MAGPNDPLSKSMFIVIIIFRSRAPLTENNYLADCATILIYS